MVMMLALAGDAGRLRSLSGQEPALPVQQPTGPEVEEIEIRGARSLEHAVIRGSILTTATRCRSPLYVLFCKVGDFKWAEVRAYLDTAQVRGDTERIRILYEAWGFPDAGVASDVSFEGDGDAVVTFDIEEGKPVVVRSLQIRGAEQVAGFQLPERLPLAVGEPYARPRLKSLEDLVRRELADLGYPRAAIEVSGDIDQAARAADVALDVQPNRPAVFGETSVRVQPPIQESVVRKRLAYRPGDPFSFRALERSEHNLYALPIVANARAQISPEQPSDSTVHVQVQVNAGKTHGFNTDINITSDHCAEVRGYWQSRYFLRGPRVFSFGAYTANLFASQVGGRFPCSSTGQGEYARLNYGVEADVRQFLGRSSMLIVRGYSARESSPDVYVQEGFGGAISYVHEFTRTLSGIFTYAPERNRLRAADLFFCGQFGVCTEAGIAALSEPNWLSPVEILGTWTSTIAPLDVRRPDHRPGHPWPLFRIPKQRWYVRAGSSVAGGYSGSDNVFQRVHLETTTMRYLGMTYEAAARVRLGGLGYRRTEILRPEVFFFGGGSHSVRGVSRNLLGPKVLSASELPAGCTPCTPATVVTPDEVAVRAVGGDLLYEGNLELRRWIGSRFQLAAFVDAGRVHRKTFVLNPIRAEGIITPGMGGRLVAPFGLIRVDLAYNPTGPRRYPLFLTQATGDLIPQGEVTFDQFTFDDPDFWTEVFRRTKFVLAIGQAF